MVDVDLKLQSISASEKGLCIPVECGQSALLAAPKTSPVSCLIKMAHDLN